MTDPISLLSDSEQEEGGLTPMAPQESFPELPPMDHADGAVEGFSSSLTSLLDSRLILNHSESDKSASSSNGLILPLPTAHINKSQPSFGAEEGHEDETVVGLNLENLPQEIATADISIASDNSFVETSSGAAAREIKRRFDQSIGVGKDVRSPYAITAFVNQHGKQMFRVGARGLSAPGASMEDAGEERFRGNSVGVTVVASSPSHPYPVNSKPRRSRMSVHSFLPPVMFKNGNVAPATKPMGQDGTRSPPLRKVLRKTRSIPNLASSSAIEPSPIVVPQAPSVGRPHAHSVSSADAYRAPPAIPHVDTAARSAYPYDIFAHVMAWLPSAPSSPSGSGSGLRSTRSFHPTSGHGFETGEDAVRISNPFGEGVEFDAPSWYSPSHLMSAPVVREMQSFESGLTARADPQPKSVRMGKLRARVSDEDVEPGDDIAGSEPNTPIAPVLAPAPETSMHSRYSTDLFDVLQNYRGLPMPERINAVTSPNTIRLSLRAEDTAAPRDDPRFVIWGEIKADDFDNNSPSRESTTDVSSGHSAMSRRKSAKDKGSLSEPDTPFVRVPSSEAPQKVLVAATIERWIAQLTSELNYDELLIFFLTYRTYISALDLGHLLICRFHWALALSTSSHDEMVRRIVRVRTFIAIRYWLLTFFSVDFVPNRALRLLFANWLNSLRKDPVLGRHKDALSIVQKLRKVVLDCKDAHTRAKDPRAPPLEKPKAENPAIGLSASVLGDLSDGHFAEALRKAVKAPEENDADIDLDFEDVDPTGVDFGINSHSGVSNPNSAVDLAMLRQPLHLTYLQYGKQDRTGSLAVSTHVPLPVPHSALSRVVVNAIGRLGRWRRVLNYRGNGPRAPLRAPLGLSGACVDASAFDVEASETGDLLLIRGGVEQYLRMFESQMFKQQKTLYFQEPPPPYEPLDNSRSSAISSEPVVQHDILEPVQETSDEGASSEEAIDLVPSAPSMRPASVQTRDSSVDEVSHWDVDVVSIDDLDLSDLSSSEDLHVSPPPGLKKLSRRLPNRRDFEFVRHSTDTVSSMGIRAHDSVLSGGSSVVSSISVSASPELEPVQAGPIHGWQMTALVDSLSDDEEVGDVEAALRRLEGQINQDQQRAKQSKVDGWVQSIRDRLQAGQFGTDRRRYSSDEEDYGEIQESRFLREESSSEWLQRRSSVSRLSASHISSRNSVSSATSPVSAVHPLAEDTQHAPANPPGLPANPPGLLANPPAKLPGAGLLSPPMEPKPPALEEVVPLEILQSRVTSAAASPAMEPPPLPLVALDIKPDPRIFTPPEKKLKKHRSFVLSHRSELLVQHFSVIDRELYLNLKFEELVSQEWMTSTEDRNILDWGQFLRERARLKAEGRTGVNTSELTVIRSRFNLMANFVASEIVLTSPNDRLMIHSKFIRIAWKAYCSKSFNTLVAILAGLDSPWVKKALSQAGVKPGIWESRMLGDLQQWTTSDGDFKHIRQTVEALSEAKPASTVPQDNAALSTDGQPSATRSRAASELKPPPPPSCVPFFGVYLSQLHRFSELPDLIDPTAPNEPVGVDPVTNSFDAPAHPEVFANLAPLPPSVQLEPLINVHKQRLVAGVVKSLVASQHLAARVQYPTEKKLFQKCLKLRGLDADMLQRALALYSGPEL